MSFKKCNKCNEVKPFIDFHKQKNSPDGRRYSCKACEHAAKKLWREENLEHCKEVQSVWHIKNKEKHNQYSRNYQKEHALEIALREKEYKRRPDLKANRTLKKDRYRKRNPLKDSAHRAVEYALRKGFIKREPCECCGSSDNIQAHHADYNKPLDIQWLCFKCHLAIDGKKPRLASENIANAA